MKAAHLSLLLLMQIASTVIAGTPAAQVVNEGGVRFLQAVEKKSKGNICLSPYSIQSALAMTFAGSDGSTRSQMAAALGFSQTPVDLAADFQKLEADLVASVQVSGTDSTLRVANRLFGAMGFSFRPGFLDLLEQAFSAPLEQLDFKKNPPLAAEMINRWVEKQTENRIQNLIPANALTKDTTLVLVNALYLKMPWAEEFPAGATKPLPFSVAGREKVNVATMSRTGSLGYRQSEGFTAVGIPFRGGQFQLLILLPDKSAA
ncbi:MAG: serpin family protein, partial [Terrimicrobiaceae bacterium]